jgi:ABC-type transport system substrate-binding protein
MNAFPNRRGLLLGALTAGAAATVAAMPAMAAAETPDPVFALLEAHKAAWARFEEQDGSSHDAFTAAAGTVDAALDAITSTPPTTVAGMRAVMEYLVELDGHSDYLPTLLRSSILRSPLLADKPCGTGIASA